MDLRGGARSVASVARRAAVHAAKGHVDTATIAERLGVKRRCVQALAALDAPPEHVRAVEVQLRLRGALTSGVLVAPGGSAVEERFA